MDRNNVETTPPRPPTTQQDFDLIHAHPALRSLTTRFAALSRHGQHRDVSTGPPSNVWSDDYRPLSRTFGSEPIYLAGGRTLEPLNLSDHHLSA